MPSRMRWTSGVFLLRLFLLVAALAASSTWTRSAAAYPWMIRHGFGKCASCHEDPMGGETLTGMGRVISDTTLSTRYDGKTTPTRNAELFWGVPEPSWLKVGGSVRYMTGLYKFPKGSAPGSFTSFPMQIDTYGQIHTGVFRVGGSLGISKVPAGSPYATAAQITRNNNGDQLNLISRSHWLGVDVGDSVLVRAGRLNLPYGLRIPEHTMWVRSSTHTDRESAQEHGVAVSYSHGALRGEVMGILGNYQISPDKYRERGYSAYAEYLLSTKVALGVSSLITNAKVDRYLLNGLPNTRQAHGVTGRFVIIPQLALLVEGDVILSTQTKTGYAGVAQADYEFAQGLHAIATGEIRDTGALNGTPTSPGVGKPQFGEWLSFGWFFFTHFDMRADLVFHQNEPITLLSQLHYYF